MSICNSLDEIVKYLKCETNDTSFLSSHFIAMRDKEKNMMQSVNLCINHLDHLRSENIHDVLYKSEDSHYLVYFNIDDTKYIVKARLDEEKKILSLVEEIYHEDSSTIVLEIEYDGTMYYGMQKQSSSAIDTIQEEIEKALKLMLKKDVIVFVSSRTDRGVHAKGQVVHFFGEGISPKNYKTALNGLLPKDIRIIKAYARSQLFNCRFDVVKKEYQYIIDMGEYDVFSKNYVWFTKINNISKMRDELSSLLGTHDFVAFCKGEKEDTVRTIYEASLHLCENRVVLKFVGDGFLHNMIRLIVGSLIEIDESGVGSLKYIIDSRDKTKTARIAPASGLYLMKIYY